MNRIVIFGLGSIGRKYASILQNDKDIDLYAYRENGKDTICNIKNIFSLDELCDIKPNIALITNPTAMHIETAIKCAENKMHLFIEKPLDMSSEEGKKLTAIDAARVMVMLVRCRMGR